MASSSVRSAPERAADPSRDVKTHFRVCRFIMEAGVKLGMRSVPVATACALYHRFCARVDIHAYEPFLVATSCIYLAGKVEEQHLRTRDIINVSHSSGPIPEARCFCTLCQPLDYGVPCRLQHLAPCSYVLDCLRYFRSGSTPLDCDQDFWDLRDSVVQCELLILRQLNFHVSFEHPHKFLLHYLLSVRALLNRHAWARSPVAETSWALLRDCYHGDMCIRHAPQHLAIAAVYLALHSYGVELPRGDKEWWQVLSSDVTRDHIDAVISDLLQLYDLEAKCI